MRLTIRLPGSLAAIHESSFARYLAAMTISRLGSGMAQIALAFAVLEFGSATDLGIVLLAREIPIIVFVLLGGVYADRLPRRTILISTSLLQGTVQIATATLLLTGNAAVWNIALLQMIFGVGGAFSARRPSG